MERPWSYCDFWGQRERIHIQAEPFASCVSKGRLLHPSQLSFCTTRIGLGLIARDSCKDSVRCCFSLAQSCPTLCNPKDCSTPGSTFLYCLTEFAQIHVIESVMLFDHLILCCSPFSSCPQSFPASESFPISQLFASGGRSIGASASASVLPVNIRG